ncbi:MAG: endopeptidase La [Azospirillaceae bacterium]|nr:endopeptidase La [Azospirillaceae bacterium]
MSDVLIAPAADPGDAHQTLPEKALPKGALIILPMRNVVLFPGIVLPLTLNRPASIAAAQAAARGDQPIGLLLQRDSDDDEPTAAALHDVGTVVSLLRYVTTPDGIHHVVAQGQRRFRVREFLTGYPYFVALVDGIEEPRSSNSDVDARLFRLREQVAEAIKLLPDLGADIASALQSIEAPGHLADFVTNFLDAKPLEKQAVLETIDLSARLDRVSSLLSYQIEVLRLSRQIGQQTKQAMDSRQREYLLREQMRAIQKELGEADSGVEQTAELEQALTAAKLPPEVDRQARKELNRLQRMPDAGAESAMLRTYLEWLAELPWQLAEEPAIDIAEARRILDEDHYGLDKVKRRILQFLAVRKLTAAAGAGVGKSPILCFVGPPGVGKTSLGQSIARAIGQKFVRVSLGGVHDEAEIRGHRRTYVGALPGNIIQALRRVGTRAPVFMLDEMDKLGSGFQGDPASALLEVLDPEQNATFRDHYLGVPFDLSRVLFIATANVLDTVPGPLRDRMEVIEIPSYTAAEKLQIALRYLVRRQLAANGLTPEQCSLSAAAIETIIADYTREAGCRNLEREIGGVFRDVAMRIAEGAATPIAIGPDDLAAILGPRRFENELAMRTSLPGVATGLAWTAVGGDILFVEATCVPGAGKLILTGQLGDVMKESAQAAFTLVKSRATALGIDPATFPHSDIHVHVPAGAIPKDGPSAGVAMFVALASLLTNRRVASDTAMTGEISLRGLVLPVGGIKEKVVAAARAGIRTVLLPARNHRDLEEIPEDTRRLLHFVWITDVDQVFAAAIGDVPSGTRGAAEPLKILPAVP